MYGMIHQAVELMVIERFGEDCWREIRASAGLTSESFIGFDHYPDHDTMALLDAIPPHVRLPREEILFELGHYWVAYAGSSPYGHAISMAGDDLYSFFVHLDRMHIAIKSNLVDAKMPSFAVRGGPEGQFDLVYRSSRDGLQPFVHGLVYALARHLGENVDVTCEPFSHGAVFHVRRLGVVGHAGS